MDGISPREQALLELSLGRPDAALAYLEDDPDPLRVEALVGARRNDDAAEELARLEAVGATPHALALARALVASDFDADFQTAVAAAPSAVDRAHAQLLYGERLRRLRRRGDAEAQLRPALEAFERLGATSWAARARRELDAVTQRSRRADANGGLTKQEGAVAALVAEGATNKEAAAKLFLSKKTVEYHLGNVYRKLGLRSRAELAAQLAGTPELVERAPPAALFGRDDDLEALRALLRRERLVTISGTGGVGKTAVARVLAAEDPEAAFVDLSAIRDPSSVVWAIAQGLGVREVGGRPLLESVAEALGPSRLLVLDNFEQVLEAKSVVAELLAAAPELRLLVTSRVPLHIAEETVHELPPLGTPRTAETALEGIRASPAVLLFEARARAIEPSFTLTGDNAAVVAEICRRLDGIPLAIELAAARVTLLAPEAILARLDKRLALLTRGRRDLPRRQRTLRATLEWSHELLAPEEEEAFARLAVFVGGFSAASAEAVTGASLDVLDALLETGLLSRVPATDGEPRATMFETVREYALERLAASPETDAVAQRHSEHFLALAEDHMPAVERGEEGLWRTAMERDYQNVRAALDRAFARDDEDLTLRFASRLGLYWRSRGDLHEGQTWLRRVLDRYDGSEHPSFPFVVYAATSLRGMAHGLAAYADGFIRARELFEQAGNLVWAARMHEMQCRVYSHLGDEERAFAEANRAVALAERLDSGPELTRALVELAELHVNRGEVDVALALLDRAEEAGATQRLRVLPQVYRSRGEAHLLRGDAAAARADLEEALDLARQSAHQPLIASSAVCCGYAAIAAGELRDAAAFFDEALEAARGTTETAECLTGFALLASARGDHRRVVRLCAAAAALDEVVLSPFLKQVAGEQIASACTEAREALGRDAAIEERAGSAMTLAEAAADARTLLAAT